ncbi:MAG TPA: hypothetical protein VIZ32_00140, partial [Vicinamibacterales bacterium]
QEGASGNSWGAVAGVQLGGEVAHENHARRRHARRAVMAAYNRRNPPRRPAFIADLLLRTLASRRLDQGGR